MFNWQGGANPTIGVELDLPVTDGWHTMTDDERDI